MKNIFWNVLGFNSGDPSILVNPVDSYGQKCGVDEAVKDKPYLFFFDITKVTKVNQRMISMLRMQLKIYINHDHNLII